MKIQYHREFLKSYKKRVAPYPKLELQFKKQLEKLSTHEEMLDQYSEIIINAI